jgi:hypothetical protein
MAIGLIIMRIIRPYELWGEKRYMKEISRKAFDVYVGFTRNRNFSPVAEEIRWYADDAATLFNAVLMHMIR